MNTGLKSLAAISVVFMFFAISRCDADFTAAGGSDAKDKFTQRWNWTFENKEEISAVEGTDWQRLVVSPVGLPKDITLRVRHVNAPHSEAANPPPPGFYEVTVKGLIRPGVGAAGAQFKHGTHYDLVRLQAVVPAAGNGAIFAGGEHFGEVKEFEYSFTPFARGKITIFASYPEGGPAERQVDAERSVEAGRRVTGRLTVSGETRTPNDYRIVFTGSGTADTTLAFLGAVDGVPGKLDLALATELFTGLDEFVAPQLFNETQNLFVGIDLVQWLSFPTLFNPFDTFDFVDGRNPLLPGFLVSTSPVTLNSTLGFVTDSPYTGTAAVVGSIDGKVVPEPASLVSLGLGALGLLGFLRRRRKIIG